MLLGQPRQTDVYDFQIQLRFSPLRRSRSHSHPEKPSRTAAACPLLCSLRATRWALKGSHCLCLTGLYQKLMAMNNATAELLLIGAVQVAARPPRRDVQERIPGGSSGRQHSRDLRSAARKQELPEELLERTLRSLAKDAIPAG
jgi:hypothetical protein